MIPRSIQHVISPIVERKVLNVAELTLEFEIDAEELQDTGNNDWEERAKQSTQQKNAYIWPEHICKTIS